MANRVFFPQAALDQWIVDGSVELESGVLTILAEGRRYRLAEAVRVLREVSGGGDSQELVGRVKARMYLEQLGAEIVETSMLLGEAAYDVEPGWLGIPVGTFAEHVGSGRGPPGAISGQEPVKSRQKDARAIALAGKNAARVARSTGP
jgi:hypothetical protein